MAEAATASSGGLSKIFGHVAKHWMIHTLWMIPMAAMMMATPAPLGAIAGAFEMLTKSFWGFFFEGGIVDLFNNTVSGDLWGSFEWGSIDMSGHAAASGADTAAHAGHAAAEHSGVCTAEQMNNIIGGMSNDELAYSRNMADRYAKGSLLDYFSDSGLCHE